MEASTHVLDVACAAGRLLSAVGAVADADEVNRVAAEADGDTESLKDDTKQPELLADAGIVGLTKAGGLARVIMEARGRAYLSDRVAAVQFTSIALSSAFGGGGGVGRSDEDKAEDGEQRKAGKHGESERLGIGGVEG